MLAFMLLHLRYTVKLGSEIPLFEIWKHLTFWLLEGQISNGWAIAIVPTIS